MDKPGCSVNVIGAGSRSTSVRVAVAHNVCAREPGSAPRTTTVYERGVRLAIVNFPAGLTVTLALPPRLDAVAALTPEPRLEVDDGT